MLSYVANHSTFSIIIIFVHKFTIIINKTKMARNSVMILGNGASMIALTFFRVACRDLEGCMKQPLFLCHASVTKKKKSHNFFKFIF